MRWIASTATATGAGLSPHLDLGGHEESRPPRAIGIRQHRAREQRLRVHRADRREIGERALDRRRAVAGVDAHGLADTQPAEVAAEDVEVDPDRAEVGDLVELVVGRHELARRDVLGDHRAGEPRAQLERLQALVALDHREQIAARDRVAEALVHGAHDAGEARHHVRERVLVRRDPPVQHDPLADDGRPRRGDDDTSSLELLGLEHHAVLVGREREAVLAPVFPGLSRDDLGVEGVRLVDSLRSPQILAARREARSDRPALRAGAE